MDLNQVGLVGVTFMNSTCPNGVGFLFSNYYLSTLTTRNTYIYNVKYMNNYICNVKYLNKYIYNAKEKKCARNEFT